MSEAGSLYMKEVLKAFRKIDALEIGGICSFCAHSFWACHWKETLCDS